MYGIKLAFVVGSVVTALGVVPAASRGYPTPEAVRHSGAYGSVGSFASPYTGGRSYIGTDPDANIRGQLLRDAPIYRT